MRKALSILGAIALILLIANIVVYTMVAKSTEVKLGDAWSNLTEMVGGD